MKNCRFYDTDTIAGYFDGTLDAETEAAFSEHLPGCSRCMEALLDLETDLFLMQSMKLGTVPKRYRSGFALFHMVRGRLDIVRNLTGEHRFCELPLPAVRGKGHKAHSFERDGIHVRVEGEDFHTFRVELNGVAGKNIEIRRNGKTVERHSSEQNQRAVFRSLERGSIDLFIDNQEFLHFIVQ